MNLPIYSIAYKLSEKLADALNDGTCIDWLSQEIELMIEEDVSFANALKATPVKYAKQMFDKLWDDRRLWNGNRATSLAQSIQDTHYDNLKLITFGNLLESGLLFQLAVSAYKDIHIVQNDNDVVKRLCSLNSYYALNAYIRMKRQEDDDDGTNLSSTNRNSSVKPKK